MVIKKSDESNNDNNNDSVTVECPELQNIFHFSDEEKCYEGMILHPDEKLQYQRQIPVEQTRYENWLSKVVDPHSPEGKRKFYTSGEGTGICKGKIRPKRVINSIMRLKTKNDAEYLLTTSTITGYNQFGDDVITTALYPEKYWKAFFKWATVPNKETGYAMRINQGVSHSELVYTLPFTKEDATKLFDLRDGNNNIQFMVKSESSDKAYEVKPQITIQETFKLFVDSDFTYLYNGNYISLEQKMLNMKSAEMEGLLPHQTDTERISNIKAQEALSQKDKMASYG